MALPGDIATNVAAGLVVEALSYPFQSLRAELERRTTVRNALRERSGARQVRLDAHVDHAVRDLARIIGTSEGKLTRSVSHLIDEIQRAGVPSTMGQMILSGRDCEAMLPAFNAIYGMFSNLPFTNLELFGGLKAALTSRIDAVDDPALLDIIRAQNHELISHLNQISTALECLDDKTQLDYSDFAESRHRLAKAIEASNRYASVETLQGSKKFRLTALAIHARLTPLDEAAIQAARAPDSEANIAYVPFRRHFNRAVILGDPGGGKSTLTQMLCIDLSNAISLASSSNSSTKVEPRDLKLPLRIILRSFEARLSKNPSYSLLDYLRDELRAALEDDASLTQRVLVKSLSIGQAVIIFDGLDEVLDVGARREMVSLIEKFAELYPSCPLLVTSRLVGYRDAPLCEDFTPYALARFRREEILKYAERGIRAVSGKKLSEARGLADQFYSQTESIGGDLRENPLMLGLMVQIYVFRGDVPSNRPEIYKECALLMFEKWDLRRQIVFNVPREDFELLDVFSFVAGRIFGDPQREEGVSREWLIAELRRHFEGWYIDKAHATRASRALVEFLTGRAWVMSEVGPGTFKFTHRTFLEYFFARGLISESRDVSELIGGKLLSHILKNEWDVISHLALQMAVFRDGGKMRQAADALNGAIAEHPAPSRATQSLLEFASKAFEYVTVPETVFVEMVHDIAERAINIGAQNSPSAVVVIRNLLQSARHRRVLARETIAKVLDKAASQAASPEGLFAFYTMGSPMRPLVLRSVGKNKYRYAISSDPSVTNGDFQDTRENHKKALHREAMASIPHAVVYMYVYRERPFEFYQTHGPKLIVGGQQISPITPIAQFLTNLRSAILLIGLEANNASHEDEDLLRFVHSVAKDAATGKLRRPSQGRDPRDDRLIDASLDELFRSVWMLHSRRRLFAKRADAISAFLVCLFFLAGETDEGARPSAGISASRQRRVEHRLESFIPLSLLREMIGLLEKAEFGLALMQWVQRTDRTLELSEAPLSGKNSALL